LQPSYTNDSRGDLKGPNRLKGQQGGDMRRNSSRLSIEPERRSSLKKSRVVEEHQSPIKPQHRGSVGQTPDLDREREDGAPRGQQTHDSMSKRGSVMDGNSPILKNSHVMKNGSMMSGKPEAKRVSIDERPKGHGRDSHAHGHDVPTKSGHHHHHGSSSGHRHHEKSSHGHGQSSHGHSHSQNQRHQRSRISEENKRISEEDDELNSESMKLLYPNRTEKEEAKYLEDSRKLESSIVESVLDDSQYMINPKLIEKGSGEVSKHDHHISRHGSPHKLDNDSKLKRSKMDEFLGQFDAKADPAPPPSKKRPSDRPTSGKKQLYNEDVIIQARNFKSLKPQPSNYLEKNYEALVKSREDQFERLKTMTRTIENQKDEISTLKRSNKRMSSVNTNIEKDIASNNGFHKDISD
jgi:hypothetical protein